MVEGHVPQGVWVRFPPSAQKTAKRFFAVFSFLKRNIARGRIISVMAKLVSVAEMLAIEQAADKSGLSYANMIENAGKSLAKATIAHSHKSNKSVLGLIGSGNNGGDTLVALELLAKKGWQATAYLVKRDPQEKHVRRARKAGVTIIASGKSGKNLSKLLPKHTVLLDGILG